MCVSSGLISMLVAFQAFTVLNRTLFANFVELCTGMFNVPLSTDRLLDLGFSFVYSSVMFLGILLESIFSVKTASRILRFSSRVR